MAKKKEESATEWDQIEIGDQVKHAKWGVGTVLFRSGNGDSAKAIVVFPEEGQKKLMLKYAGLIKVGSTSLKSVERLKAEAEAEAKARTRTRTRVKPKPKPLPLDDELPVDELADDEDVDLDLEELDDDEPVEDEDEVVGFDDEDDAYPAHHDDDEVEE